MMNASQLNTFKDVNVFLCARCTKFIGHSINPKYGEKEGHPLFLVTIIGLERWPTDVKIRESFLAEDMSFSQRPVPPSYSG